MGQSDIGHDASKKVRTGGGAVAPDLAAHRLVMLVARARGVTPRLVVHPSRCRADVAAARQLAMYLMHVSLGRSLADVARFFGRDRTTVAHACARIEDLRDSPRFDDDVDRLESLIELEASADEQGPDRAAG